MIQDLFAIIFPVLATAGVGYGWARTGRPYDADQVTTLISVIGAPCLIFHTLAHIQVEVSSFLTVVGASLLAIVLFLGIGAVGLRLARLPLRVYLPSLTFGNTGNMGLPLALFAFGQEGLTFGAAVFTAFSVVHFTLGPAIASGTLSPARLVRVPLVYGVLAALPFLLSGTRPPQWLANVTHLLAGMTVPLMLITLGVSLAKLRVAVLGRGAVMAVARLGLGFAVGVGLSRLFGLEGVARGVFILDCSMPVAVFNYLFAQRHGSAPEEVASVVVMSTALSFLTLPLLLLYVL